ncbi:MAG: putative Ig domain-containing protein [Mycobacterium sp.]|nr:putative Ig domain-containing protein [Mycobacterium sp.]
MPDAYFGVAQFGFSHFGEVTVVGGGPAPMFTADSPPPDAVIGVAYSYQFVASGTPAPTFSIVSGATPDGLTLFATTGILAGTPLAAGTFTFAIAASNGNLPDAVTPTLTIDVASVAPPPSDTTPPGGVPMFGLKRRTGIPVLVFPT